MSVSETEICDLRLGISMLMREVTAQVRTARPLSADAQEALRARLGQLTGSRVRLQFEVDDELIGGVVTRIGSTLYDGSVRGRLQQIKQRMVGEA